jgi:ribosome-associated protein
MVIRKTATRRVGGSKKTLGRPATKKWKPARTAGGKVVSKAGGKPISKAVAKPVSKAVARVTAKAVHPTKTSRPRPPQAIDDTRPLAILAAEAALDKKGLDPVLLDLRGKSDYTDYLLVLSAESERQVDAIARAIEERLSAAGRRRHSVEAAGESSWLLMDFGDLVVHVFFRGARSLYDLEGLWADAERVPLPVHAAAVS